MFELTDIAVILFITTLINIVTTGISWLKQKTGYGLYFALGMIGVTIWTFAAGLDYAAVPIPLKILFAKLEYLGYQSALTLFAVSMTLYAGHEAWLKKNWVKIVFFIIPVSNVLLAWTNELHGWLWSGFTASVVGNNVVNFEHGPGFIWTVFTGYLMIAVIAANMLQVAFTGADLLRKQARLLLLALLIPVASNLLYLFDAFRAPGVDWSSITFSIACLLFLQALYGLRFLEVVPIARNVLIEQMTDAILVLDNRGYLIDFNPAAQAIFGLRKDDLWSLFQVALARFPEISALLTAPSKGLTKEIRIGNEGNVFDFRLTSLADRRGRVYGQLVVMRDISERKRVEETLHRREQEFKTLVENSPDAITRFDREWHYQYVNPARAWYFGRPVSEIQGKTVWDLLGPDEVGEGKIADEALKRIFENPKEFTVEYETETPDGMRWVQSRGVPEFAKDGSVESVLVVTRDITERKQMENALRESGEQYRIIVQTAMDGFWQMDMQGSIVYVNDAYCQMSGYSEQELLSMKISDLDVAETPDITVAHIQRVLAQGQDRFETRHRRKDGSVFDVEISAQYRDGQFVAFLRNITERNRTDEIVRLRLRLWEYAASHSIDELMQKALDEIGNLTDSPIGFYHFVEEDQNTLSLQAWSTRTLAEFCHAEGKGLHYPINDAGVWVDCVRERKPVIHNNYSSLPHRKGLPAGHAEVIRELVVPTMRNNQVVAILGVGNKPTDYDEKDVELVSYIADIIWTIVEQKRANEQIRQLNAKLEQLAMTDDLTGLFNRRLFFKRGAEEIKRSQRYQLPLSLLMMDIDEFKIINDTYGHDAGDRILRLVADTLRLHSREVDVVVRLGGEEFGLLLPNTEEADALVLAERLRSAVEGATSFIQDQQIGVTMSIGLAVFGKEVQNIDHLLKNADTAMYQAKNHGRNRVIVYHEKN